MSGSLWYSGKRICHKGVFFILDAPFALMAAYRDTKKTNEFIKLFEEETFNVS